MNFMAPKEAIIRDLSNAIDNGELKPGEHLTENTICRRFGVSRTPAREILKQLEREGLVKIIPNVGARVVDFSVKDVSDIYDILIILDGAAAHFACSQISDEEIRKLKECQFKIENATSQKNLDFLLELNFQFHRLIIASTKNSHLIEIRKNFENLAIRFGRLAAIAPRHSERILEQHPKIINAIAERNAPLAEFLARQHMEDAKATMLNYIQDLRTEKTENKKISKHPIAH